MSRWDSILDSPEGTLAAEIASRARNGMVLPEIVFFAFESLLAGRLLASGTKLLVGGAVLPDIRLAVLAESGAGKTTALQTLDWMLGKALNLQETSFGLDAPVSAAALFDYLSEGVKGCADVDHFDFFYQGLRHRTGGRKRRDMLFQIFRHEDLSWTTKKDGTRTVTAPALCILGLAIPSLYVKAYADDGGFFGEHFLVVHARRRPGPRRWMDGCRDLEPGALGDAWTELVQSAAGREYVPSAEGLAVHEATCRELFASMPETEALRHAEELHRHALLRHVMCGDGAVLEIGPEPYRWAAMTMDAHLADERDLGLPALRRKRPVRP